MGNRNIYPGRQWDDRFAICAKELPRHFYSKSEEIPVTGFTTRERLSFEEACRMAGKEATPIKPGTAWGNLWEYGWFCKLYGDGGIGREASRLFARRRGRDACLGGRRGKRCGGFKT